MPAIRRKILEPLRSLWPDAVRDVKAFVSKVMVFDKLEAA
jgi:hypothetical protein